MASFTKVPAAWWCTPKLPPVNVGVLIVPVSTAGVPLNTGTLLVPVGVTVCWCVASVLPLNTGTLIVPVILVIVVIAVTAPPTVNVLLVALSLTNVNVGALTVPAGVPPLTRLVLLLPPVNAGALTVPAGVYDAIVSVGVLIVPVIEPAPASAVLPVITAATAAFGPLGVPPAFRYAACPGAVTRSGNATELVVPSAFR